MTTTKKTCAELCKSAREIEGSVCTLINRINRAYNNKSDELHELAVDLGKEYGGKVFTKKITLADLVTRDGQLYLAIGYVDTELDACTILRASDDERYILTRYILYKRVKNNLQNLIRCIDSYARIQDVLFEKLFTKEFEEQKAAAKAAAKAKRAERARAIKTARAVEYMQSMSDAERKQILAQLA